MNCKSHYKQTFFDMVDCVHYAYEDRQVNSMLIGKIRSLQIFGVMSVIAVVLSLSVLPSGAQAVPINATDNASQKAKEHSNERSDVAGWMQSGKVLASQEASQPSPAMQACMNRQPIIHKKITAISSSASAHEAKLTAIFVSVVELQQDNSLTSPEIDTMLRTATTIKENRIDPLLLQLAEYKSAQKINCANGVENVVASIIQAQSITEQLRESLSEYRNSIKVVLIAVRDSSREANR